MTLQQHPLANCQDSFTPTRRFVPQRVPWNWRGSKWWWHIEETDDTLWWFIMLSKVKMFSGVDSHGWSRLRMIKNGTVWPQGATATEALHWWPSWVWEWSLRSATWIYPYIVLVVQPSYRIQGKQLWGHTMCGRPYVFSGGKLLFEIIVASEQLWVMLLLFFQFLSSKKEKPFVHCHVVANCTKVTRSWYSWQWNQISLWLFMVGNNNCRTISDISLMFSFAHCDLWHLFKRDYPIGMGVGIHLLYIVHIYWAID